jgi:glyoxylase-like metal-dependent hydrolase (beta-lactamase superfamily II)
MAWHVGAAVIDTVTETEAVAPADGFFLAPDVDLAPYQSWLAPFLSAEGHLRFVVRAMLLAVDGLRIVVDTCVGNGKNYGPMVPTFNDLDTPFLENLTAAGFAPDDVDLVVCTHLHEDHVGWNTMLVDDEWVPTFPRARYVFSRADIEHWQQERDMLKGQPPRLEVGGCPFDVSVAPLLERGLVDAIEPTHQVSASVSLISTPGHTPGHVSVRIDSNGSSAVITGDMVHSPVQLVRPEWSSLADVDPERAQLTRERMREQWGNHDVLIVGTHFPFPTAGRLVSDAAGEWRFTHY